MNEEKFIKDLSKSIIPQYYKKFDKIDADLIQIVFLSPHYGLGRYMLSLSFIDEIDVLENALDLYDIKETVRGIIKKKYKANWLIGNVGLQMVIIIKNQKNLIEDRIKADKTGIHSVIIQGIHVMDVKNKDFYFNETKWIGIPFSRAKKYNQILINLL